MNTWDTWAARLIPTTAPVLKRIKTQAWRGLGPASRENGFTVKELIKSRPNTTVPEAGCSLQWLVNSYCFVNVWFSVFRKSVIKLSTWQISGQTDTVFWLIFQVATGMSNVMTPSQDVFPLPSTPVRRRTARLNTAMITTNLPTSVLNYQQNF